MSGSAWPPPPATLYDDKSGGWSHTGGSATPTVLWGGGTTKPITGQGLYLVTFETTCRMTNAGGAGFYAEFGLQKSTDGTTWSDVDAVSGGLYHDFKFTTAQTNVHLNPTFFYTKTTLATEYLRVLVKSNTTSPNGDITGETYATGWSTYLRVFQLPSWGV